MSALAILAAVLTGCEPAPPPDAAKCNVVRPTLRFAIDVPEGWTWTDFAGDVVLEITRAPTDEVPAAGPADESPAPAPDAAPKGASDTDTGAPGAPAPAPSASAAKGATDASGFADDLATRHRARTQAVVHVAAIDRGGLSLDAWADQTVASSQELQRDLEVLSREPARLVDGRPALRIVLKNPRGLEPFIQELWLTVVDDRAYAVIATAPESQVPGAREAFDHCFRTFVAW